MKKTSLFLSTVAIAVSLFAGISPVKADVTAQRCKFSNTPTGTIDCLGVGDAGYFVSAKDRSKEIYCYTPTYPVATNCYWVLDEIPPRY